MKIRYLQVIIRKFDYPFVFFSDAHWGCNNKSSPIYISRIVNTLKVKHVFFGGDCITYSFSSKNAAIALCKSFQKYFERYHLSFHYVFGNHDDNSYRQDNTDAVLTTDEVYSTWRNNINTKNIIQGKDYSYYIDDDSSLIRFVILNTIGDISDNYIKNIESTLLASPNGYRIVVMAHIWVEWNGTVHEPNTSTNRLIEMFDDYNARKGIFSSACAKVIMLIGGHIHTDRTFKTRTGIPMYITDSDAAKKSCGAGYLLGLPSEQCITVFVIKNKYIIPVRIGRGLIKRMSYK